MRAFIGFFLPDKIVRYVQGIGADLEKLPMKCKMVEPENIHVCLSFLGKIDNDQAGVVKEVLNGCVDKSSPKLRVGSIRFVPNEKHIRVIVIDVLDPTGTLSEITEEVKRKVGGSMHPAHITLCRIRRIENKDIIVSAIKRIKTEDLEFDLRSLCLIKSEITRKGPVYKVVHETKLESR